MIGEIGIVAGWLQPAAWPLRPRRCLRSWLRPVTDWPIDLGAVFTHEVRDLSRGALLVDREGRPVGIHVTSYMPGIGYAVAWRDVLARFPQVAVP